MIKTHNNKLIDEHGRTLLLRGVNLGGSTKVPYTPNGATWNPEGFFNHRDVSFVGRPFPLEEADEHFTRLKEWGLTFLRFLITWEAVEHAGPGIYDQEYLDYIYKVIAKAHEYGIEVFIDPHQDTWSRFSGGDGAPGWTFETIGMDITMFKETGAAIVHATHGDPFPKMIWPSNYGKLANLTMWTLFFGGNQFAPKTQLDGVPIQEYLQSHYINAVKQVAIKLKDLPNVVGFDTLNEPSNGFIGMQDLRSPGGVIQLGSSPTGYQAILLGAGYPQEVGDWVLRLTGLKQKGSSLINPDRVSVWMGGFEPVWKQNGVWDVDKNGNPHLLKPNYFATIEGHKINFHRDFFRPFANRYALEIRSIQPEAIIFVEGVPHSDPLTWTAEDEPNIVHAGHWYDSLTLLQKHYTPWLAINTLEEKVIFGKKKVRQGLAAQISQSINFSEKHMNNAPTLIGEVGIPYDMQNKKAYRTGDFSMQVRAMNATMHALEADLVSFTLWNYTADNTNERGDQWNDEDLSIFSRDQQTGSGDIHDGGRALDAVIRPYARAVAGEPLHLSFDIKKKIFTFEFRHDPDIAAPTEFFIPNYHYPKGYDIQVSDGEYSINQDTQTLTYKHSAAQEIHRVIIKP